MPKLLASLSGRLTIITLLAAITLGNQLQANSDYLNITPTPPHDTPSRNVSTEELAKFAWQEFLALNWKAAFNPNSKLLGTRGKPDLAWNYSQPVPSLLVWQTYAQTTELRPNGRLSTPWNQLRVPKYSYQTTLIKGAPNAANNLFNNLDEDNEIGSCDIYAHFNQQSLPRNLILFQVRVNHDEYEYLRKNFPDQYNPSGSLAKATKNAASNLSKPPYVYYPGASGPDSSCKCPPNVLCLPCGSLPNNGPAAGAEGTIEVKTAWRRLEKGEDASRYFTAKSIYYDLPSGPAGPATKIAYYNDTFALIAMHIIHKTRNFPDFVFATFEQVDAEKPEMDTEFVNLSPPPSPTPPLGTEVGSPVHVTRQHPYTQTLDTVTNAVHQQLQTLNPKTVWQYYRLTGVQGAAADCPVNPTKLEHLSGSECITLQRKQHPNNGCEKLNDVNYYMANFVVESDALLQTFSGPGFGNNPYPACQNTAYNNKIYNQGGCKGCHGVAQTGFGTDFSFLLDFGHNKPAIAPATIHYYPPSSLASPSADHRKNYLKGDERLPSQTPE